MNYLTATDNTKLDDFLERRAAARSVHRALGPSSPSLDMPNRVHRALQVIVLGCPGLFFAPPCAAC